MEAATAAVHVGDSVMCNNVLIKLKKRNGKYYGELRLPHKFCKRRGINLSANSKDGESETNDYLCITYHTGQVR
jgi:hypothetical protein